MRKVLGACAICGGVLLALLGNHLTGQTMPAAVASTQISVPEFPIDVPNSPAPLFDDPVWHGASDPFVIWNPMKKEWWMYYTQRRASLPNPNGVDWVHGSAIGIATTKDGAHWSYLGTAQGDHDLSDPIEGNVTWWAPCFLQTGDTFHMFVVQVDGIYTKWMGQRHILHFTSTDMLNWKYSSTAKLSSDRVIDPTVYNVGGTWFMVYKDEAHSSHTWLAHSSDLDNWTADKDVVGGSGHEAPFTFQWKGKWWLIVDGYGKGLRIYQSPNGTDGWVLNATVLSKKDGRRTLDNSAGYHPGIVVQGDQCVLFYFTEYPDHHTYIQVTELQLGADGKVFCDRNKYAPASTEPETQPNAK